MVGDMVGGMVGYRMVGGRMVGSRGSITGGRMRGMTSIRFFRVNKRI